MFDRIDISIPTLTRPLSAASTAAFPVLDQRHIVQVSLERLRAPSWSSTWIKQSWDLMQKDKWHKFPGHPVPAQSESLNSWFARFANANGLTELGLTKTLFGTAKRAPRLDWDKLESSTVFDCLATCSGATDLRSLTFASWFGDGKPNSPSAEILSDVIVGRKLENARQYPICLECLAENNFHQLEWRIALLPICERHGQLLDSPCENCSAQIDALEGGARAIVDRVLKCPTCEPKFRRKAVGYDFEVLTRFQNLVRMTMRGYRVSASCQKLLSGIISALDTRELLDIYLRNSTEYVSSRLPMISRTGSLHRIGGRSSIERFEILRWLARLFVEGGDAFKEVVSELGRAAPRWRVHFHVPTDGEVFMDAVFRGSALRRDRSGPDYRDPHKIEKIRRTATFLVCLAIINPPERFQPGWR